MRHLATTHYGKAFIGLLFLTALMFVLTAMRSAPHGLQQVFDRGELTVVTRHDPVSYFHNHHGDTGFDYEMVNRFATRLGVKLNLVVVDNLNQAYAMLESGKADLIAAAVTPNQARTQTIAYSQGYLTTGNQFIYRLGSNKPRSLADLAGHSIAVLDGSTQAQALKVLASHGLNIKVTLVDSTDSRDLLKAVSSMTVDYALINRQAYALQHPLFPEVSTAFTLNDNQQFVWALKKGGNAGLYQAANQFIQQMTASGSIKVLAAQLYGKNNAFNLYASRVFQRHMQKRLPTYSGTFYKAAHKNQFDWRLLAAMSYQESHWNPHAVSPTGVRGLMMLTRTTAAALGVNRNNPTQSIKGGARYLRELLNRMPADIPEPDRLWMAIAAYNIGLGHLEDARVLTDMQDADPDSWPAVRKRLLMLENPKYASKVQYGVADGGQAVTYVTHIQRYYNLLVWAGNSIDSNKTLVAMAD